MWSSLRPRPKPPLPARNVFLLTAALLFAAGCVARRPQGPFKNYACYYGYGRLDELAAYDLVVLQPWAYNPPDIAALKTRGPTVLAYLSAGEDDELRRDDGRGPGGYAPWYLDQFTGPGLQTPGADGRPDQNAEWNSYFVDPSHRRWRRFLKRRVNVLRKQGFDGLFLDTVLIPRNAYTADLEERMAQGMVRLVKALRRAWPSGYFLVNNGWDHLGEWGKTVDGVMAEGALSDDAALPPQDQGEAARIARLIHSTGPHPRDAFSLDYVPADAALHDRLCRQAAALGFVAALYPDDEDGRRLKRLPLRTCSPQAFSP